MIIWYFVEWLFMHSGKEFQHQKLQIITSQRIGAVNEHHRCLKSLKITTLHGDPIKFWGLQIRWYLLNNFSKQILSWMLAHSFISNMSYLLYYYCFYLSVGHFILYHFHCLILFAQLQSWREEREAGVVEPLDIWHGLYMDGTWCSLNSLHRLLSLSAQYQGSDLIFWPQTSIQNARCSWTS